MKPKSAALERIDIRVPAGAKNLIRRAAEAKGVTVSNFVISAAYDAAQATLLGVEIMKLSPEQTARILGSLEGTAEPNEALKNLMKPGETVH